MKKSTHRGFRGPNIFLLARPIFSSRNRTSLFPHRVDRYECLDRSRCSKTIENVPAQKRCQCFSIFFSFPFFPTSSFFSFPFSFCFSSLPLYILSRDKFKRASHARKTCILQYQVTARHSQPMLHPRSPRTRVPLPMHQHAPVQMLQPLLKKMQWHYCVKALVHCYLIILSTADTAKNP